MALSDLFKEMGWKDTITIEEIGVNIGGVLKNDSIGKSCYPEWETCTYTWSGTKFIKQ